MSLSARADVLSKPDPSFLFWEVIQNAYHPQSNPDGYVCLGLAENELLHDTLAKHLHDNISLTSGDFTYGDGKKQLRASFSRFLNKYFNPVVPVQPQHITISNGCSSAIEHLAWALGNPGDSFLLGRPYYGTFVPDVTLRMGTKLATVSFGDIDPLSADGVAKYEETIQQTQSSGGKIAGLILAHPHNPLGRCYPRHVLVELMKLCQKYQIHLISDEIYALSIFQNTVDTASGVDIHPFESALSIDLTGIIDPALVHVVWGMSKDFGANGLRLGAIISQNHPGLHQALLPASLYASTSSITDHVASNLLDDEAWVEKYIENNRRALQAGYEHATSWAKRHGFPYAPGVNAAFFLWLDLGAAYRKTHLGFDGDIDKTIMDALLAQKVFLASGVQFGSEKPGWFRIVFSQRREILDEGLERIVTALK